MSPTLKVLTGHVFEKLLELPEKSVHTVITSLPYWGLRSYLPADHPLKQFEIGQEATPLEYIEKMVQVFRLVWRVLRDDGQIWVNMGDCYAASRSYQVADNKNQAVGPTRNLFRSHIPDGFKPKDLIGMPWRLALALQADGWYLRQDIIWSKPNPMPSSVTDRPTTSHEYIFLLTKNEHYFYDHEAIKEPVTGTANSRGSGVNPKAYKTPDGWDTGSGSHGSFHKDGREKGKTPAQRKQDEAGNRQYTAFNERWKNKQNESFSSAISDGLMTKRNKRSVWTVPTFAYKGKHYATFPPDLIRPCILAGTSEKGCCAACGAPYERIVENGPPDLEHQRLCGGDLNGEYHGQSTKDYANGKAQDASATKARILAGMVEKITVGWKKTCKCETNEIVPCTVMDPFLGSGTTAMVALEYGRNAIGIDLDPRNMELIDQRTQQSGFALP